MECVLNALQRRFSNESWTNSWLFSCGYDTSIETVRDVRTEGDDLNTVQWQEVIEMRRRDMVDVSKLDEFTADFDSQKLHT